MKRERMKYFPVLSLFFILILALSCGGGKAEKVPETVSTAVAADTIRLIKISSPEEKAFQEINSDIDILITPVNRNRIPDSVVIAFSGKRITVLTSGPWEYSVPSSLVASTGRKPLKATAWKDGKSQSLTRFVELRSDTDPPSRGYRVVQTFPHSRDAFTQGLFYDKGLLYEGTGQETGSSLREVELETGKVLRQHNLESSLFGEGVTLVGDMIFQVTWQNRVGFVYEKSTFRQIKKIYYGTEGWGLTTMGDRIVMSDGTNVLYFFEPGMFTVTSRLEVYDNKGPVDTLNELEYIDGVIWANMWMKDLIARIDPASGKVIDYIDLKGLLPEGDRRSDTDVLNGIAYDPEGKRIFVTGKKWPKLFQITVIQ